MKSAAKWERYRQLLGSAMVSRCRSSRVGRKRCTTCCDSGRRPRAVEASSGTAGIGAGIHYPIPLHLQKAYAARATTKRETSRYGAGCCEILSLPMFPGLTEEMQARVVEKTAECVSRLVAVGS